MPGFVKGVHWRTVSGEAVTVGDTTVTPVSQALTVGWPGGGLVWNRPVAVLVERGGVVQRRPILDVTRIAQLGLAGLSCWVVLVALVATRRRMRHG